VCSSWDRVGMVMAEAETASAAMDVAARAAGMIGVEVAGQLEVSLTAA